MQLGLVENTNDEYHQGEGVSCSDLKLMIEKSPLHLWAKKFDPDRQPHQQTEALLLGSAIHCAVLEPDDFPYRYAVVPEGITRQSKIGKELFAELEQEGRQPLTDQQYRLVTRTAASSRNHPVVRYLLAKRGRVEQSIYWLDKATGVLCKLRADYMLEPCAEFPNGLIVDLKSAEDASESGFSRAAYDYRYHMQAAWYPDGFQQVFGTAEPPAFLFAASEKESPFATAVYPASARMVELGRIQCSRALMLYAECQRTGQWPGYPAELRPLPLPPWGDNELKALTGAN